jgi:hypothetical protein
MMARLARFYAVAPMAFAPQWRSLKPRSTKTGPRDFCHIGRNYGDCHGSDADFHHFIREIDQGIRIIIHPGFKELEYYTDFP